MNASAVHPAMTHYERLGIQHDASPEQIKHAFREQALKTHPDMRRGRTADIRRACGEFALLREAYVTLSDPQRRAHYDTGLGSAGPPPSEPAPVTRGVRRAHRIVPPMPPFAPVQDHAVHYADELHREVWGEAVAVYLKRGWVSLCFLTFSLAVAILAWSPFSSSHGLLRGLLERACVFSLCTTLWCAWDLGKRLWRIRAAGGFTDVWRRAGGWRAIREAHIPDPPVERPTRRCSRWEHVLSIGILLHLLPLLSVGLVLTGFAELIWAGAVTLAVEVVLLVWYWRCLFRRLK